MTAEVKPFGEKVGRDHAIVSMAFGIEFSEALERETLSKVLSLHDSVKEDLPGRKQKKSLTITMQEGPGAVKEEGLGAVIFESVNKDGSIAKSLTVASEHAFVNVNDYASWADAWEFAYKILGIVVPVIQESTAVKAVTLQYLDRFYVSCPLNEFNNSWVLRSGTKYIPPHIFDLKGPWHSNNGFFDRVETPLNTFVLNNVNISLSEKKGFFESDDVVSEIELNLSHRALFNVEPIGFGGLFDDECFKKLMSQLHDIHKNLFGDLLSSDVSKIIGLYEERGHV